MMDERPDPALALGARSDDRTAADGGGSTERSGVAPERPTYATGDWLEPRSAVPSAPPPPEGDAGPGGMSHLELSREYRERYGPHHVGAMLLDNVIERGDDFGDIANSPADDLRDALKVAADRLRSAAGGCDPTPTAAAMADLRERLTERADHLTERAENHYDQGESERLGGQAEGVDLAISFVDEYLCGVWPAGPDDAGEGPGPDPVGDLEGGR